jgi:2-haloacid dehalogenase
MMVSAASHTPDVVGAKTVGLRVASVARPDEFGPGTASSVPNESVDVIAQNLIDLADKLSAGRG